MIPRRQRSLGVFLSACILVGGGGCSQHAAREMPPALDPDMAGAAAIAEYDANHDGVISGRELDKCPALKRAAARIDPQGTGKLTADSIAARIKCWQASRLATLSVLIVVRLDGQPLAGANVTAEPEKFLGATVAAAKGVSDSAGNAPMARADKPGMNCGFYKIRVSKMVNGQESVPARYNKDTELGIEVAIDADELQGGIKLDLASR